MFTITMDEYNYLLYNADYICQNYGNEFFIQEFASDVNSLEEMIFFYAKRKGKQSEARNKIEEFLSNCSGKINFTDLTNIKAIALEGKSENNG